jgi:hypothetical protein
MKTIYLLCISTLLLLSSCGIHKTSYIAPMTNTPAFAKKKELYFNGAVSPSHTEFQGGVALTNHIGITAGRFYSGSIRNSNELGLNLYTRIGKNFYIGSTFGGGKTKIGSYYTSPFEKDFKTELHVNYSSLFIQPSAYFVEQAKHGTFRYGISLKHSTNWLTNYYYGEFRTFTDNSIKEQTLYTAPKQVFNTFSPVIFCEYNFNKFSLGGHWGYKTTSSITAYTQHTNSSAPIQEPKQRNQRNLYYWPLILDFYVGIRL